MEIVFAGVAFIVLFTAWVVLPSVIKRRHVSKIEETVD